MLDYKTLPLLPSDRNWVTRMITIKWGGNIVVAHGEVFHPADLPGFAAFIGKKPVGLLTYSISDNDLEIVTINSWRERQGIGTALIDLVKLKAYEASCRRLFLVTTNNNTHALHFYQKYGFVISSIRINVIEKSRMLKPQIPLLDKDGLPIRDEIELEIIL